MTDRHLSPRQPCVRRRPLHSQGNSSAAPKPRPPNSRCRLATLAACPRPHRSFITSAPRRGLHQHRRHYRTSSYPPYALRLSIYGSLICRQSNFATSTGAQLDRKSPRRRRTSQSANLVFCPREKLLARESSSTRACPINIAKAKARTISRRPLRIALPALHQAAAPARGEPHQSALSVAVVGCLCAPKSS